MFEAVSGGGTADEAKQRDWLVLRRRGDYREDWRRWAQAPAFEEAPFRVRIQCEADLEAARWRLLAWQDPEDGDAVWPFWTGARTLEGTVKPGAEPLTSMVADGGAEVEGLRLLDGTLIVKVVHRGAAIRIGLREPAPIPADAGIGVVHDFGLRIPKSASALVDFWAVAGEPAPSPERPFGVLTGGF